MQVGDIPGQEREIFEKGLYTIFPKEIKKKRGDGKAHSYLEVEYKITTGQYKDKPIWDIISFSPKALWKVKQWLLAFGVVEEQELPIEMDADQKPVVDEEALHALLVELVRGRTCEAAVDTEEPDEEGIAKGWKTRNVITEYRVESTGTEPPWED